MSVADFQPVRRGEIWFVALPSDPPGKNARPVVIISTNSRNQHPRADTVLVVPLSTAMRDSPTHILLSPGESGLKEPGMIHAESVTTVRKQVLLAPRAPLRQLSETKLRQIARCIVLAMGLVPDDLR